MNFFEDRHFPLDIGWSVRPVQEAAGASIGVSRASVLAAKTRLRAVFLFGNLM
jgi:hypothetical protein